MVSLGEKVAGTTTAGVSAWLEFPFIKDVIDNPVNFVHGFGNLTPLIVAGIVILASRGVANIAKAGMILTGYGDQYYNTTDLIKLDHPIIGNLFLPMNRTRWGSRAR